MGAGGVHFGWAAASVSRVSSSQSRKDDFCIVQRGDILSLCKVTSWKCPPKMSRWLKDDTTNPKVDNIMHMSIFPLLLAGYWTWSDVLFFSANFAGFQEVSDSADSTLSVQDLEPYLRSETYCFLMTLMMLCKFSGKTSFFRFDSNDFSKIFSRKQSFVTCLCHKIRNIIHLKYEALWGKGVCVCVSQVWQNNYRTY